MLKLYNTLTRQKEEFKPLDPKRVTLYACGPTVYNYIHIGNARMIVVFDLLFRVLRQIYGEDHVVYARNITDVDDKIIEAAKKENVPIDTITKKYTDALLDDLKGVHTLEPTFQPLATQYIPHMIKMIEQLIENGHAYVAEGHVLFNVPSYPEYGALSRRDRDEQIAGARVEVAPYKRDPADFVLWKPSTPDLPGWDSPWGFGRPGWHIECSAMATEILGKTFDIHGGGLDLTFPHHENEIAQSCCANKHDQFAKLWMHNGFINVDNEKMSKSLGNFRLLHDLLKEYPGEAIRYALLSAHYRQPAEFNLDLLKDAKTTLDRWYRIIDKYDYMAPSRPTKAFEDALKDDLNTPAAFAELHRLANEINKPHEYLSDTEPGGLVLQYDGDNPPLVSQFKACANLVGILTMAPAAWFKGDNSEEVHIEARIAARNKARLDRHFAEADLIRKELSDMGIVLEDDPNGKTKWRRA